MPDTPIYDPPVASHRRPFNLMQWVHDHRAELTPPVANKQVWREADMIVMMVGGGNERNDFHDDPREEFFYQLKGDMNLVIWEGEGNDPYDHSDLRGRDLPAAFGPAPLTATARPRLDRPRRRVPARHRELDGFEWVCANCAHLVHRVELQVQAIDQDLPPLFAAFNDDLDARTCPNCGVLHAGKDGRL